MKRDKRKNKRVIISWTAKRIEVGLHPCVERNRKGKRECFWYAYDLTSYSVGNGPTAMKALENLFWTLWAHELLAAEEKAKGWHVVRERLHKRCKDAIPELRRAVKRWGGYTINDVEWRKWAECPFKGKKARELLGVSSKKC